MRNYDSVMMQVAELWASQSHCKRKQVGAVIAKDGRILSNGYNGTISGTDNNCEEKIIELPCCRKKINANEIRKSPKSDNVYKYKHSCNGKNKTITCSDEYLDNITPTTNEFTLHAEQNAIMFCAREGIPTKDTTIYITHSPCKNCAKLIAQCGITRVVYKHKYKDTSGLDFLSKIGIDITELNN